MSWETVIGLEVHAELSTKSKIFCTCTTAFGGEPNTHVCPVCAGMPGALPYMNHEVVEFAIKAGLALGCSITQHCKFDRKNYFYPDLPKAYQVSQLYSPICQNGKLEIETNGQKKVINIREIHIEEDAGKLLHDTKQGVTFVDYNRCGVPLIEIVSQPDFRSEEEVVAYLEKLREILLYLGICDCKMQEGSMRADINLSIRQKGESEFGIRTEMKNMNSFRAIGRAIAFETERQIEILNSGGQVIQETRRWDDDKGASFGMRSKENAQDYRYFPEPDLLPMDIDDNWIRRITEDLPELAHQKRIRYMKEFNLSEADANILTSHKNISDLFEEISDNSKVPKEAANLVIGEIMHLMSKTNTLPENLLLDSSKLSVLICFVLDGKINRNAYKEVVEAVFMTDVDPEEYILKKGLMMLSDDNVVEEVVDAVLSANEKSIADYRAGKDKAFGFLVGQVMKELRGKGNPAVITKILKEKLDVVL